MKWTPFIGMRRILRQYEEDELEFHGPKRKAREGEQWIKFTTPEGKTVVALKKKKITLKEAREIMTRSFLTTDEKIVLLKEKGASESMIRMASRRGLGRGAY